MSHSNHSGRMARSMIEINPHMSGPVEPMPDPKTRHYWPDVALYIIGAVVMIGLAIAGQA